MRRVKLPKGTPIKRKKFTGMMWEPFVTTKTAYYTLGYSHRNFMEIILYLGDWMISVEKKYFEV